MLHNAMGRLCMVHLDYHYNWVGAPQISRKKCYLSRELPIVLHVLLKKDSICSIPYIGVFTVSADRVRAKEARSETKRLLLGGVEHQRYDRHHSLWYRRHDALVP